MREVTCEVCGWRFPLTSEPGVGSPPGPCPRCSSRLLTVEADTANSGAETNFYPETLAQGLGLETEGRDDPAVPARAAECGPTGTHLLGRDEVTRASPEADLVSRGQLHLQGVTTGENPFLLREARTVVGRRATGLSVDDPALSRSHFEIEARGRDFFLRDLDSSNGTFLNGHPVRTAKLASGDQIRAGRTNMEFRIVQAIRVGSG